MKPIIKKKVKISLLKALFDNYFYVLLYLASLAMTINFIMHDKNNKLFIILFIITIALPLIMLLSYKKEGGAFKDVQVEFDEIKDYLEINNNKLKVKPLPENYFYEDKNLNPREIQEFDLTT